MDFVLMLHSHLPFVLNHGRWPHGSDWLAEATLDSYLPLIEALYRLDERHIRAPVTIGVTPVLANQLSGAAFNDVMEQFFSQRLAACDEVRESHLAPLVSFWRARFERLRRVFRSLDGDVASAFRQLEERGMIEIVGSAATHAYLPLLGRDESVRLQLAIGQDEHRRVFGRRSSGCWLPECAYRPRGQWRPTPDAPGRGRRSGIEEHLTWAGFEYFFTDAHLAHAGDVLGAHSGIPLGAERFDVARHDPVPQVDIPVTRSPYRAYRVTSAQGGPTAVALVRDPKSSMQVWSRDEGYPGDEWYLEFHKIRWPGGLKFWRVSGTRDLGAKRPYEPVRALAQAGNHAGHFVTLLGRTPQEDGGIIVAPFDTELFGHWWFEGVDFLGTLYERLRSMPSVRPVTASRSLEDHRPTQTIRLARGSWGSNGDDSMWLNDGTRWMWDRLWALEERFWTVAPRALESDPKRQVLAQAARELTLAQASDWPFIISTGAVADYGTRRFNRHCEDAERLVAGLEGALELDEDELRREAEILYERDAVFPNILAAVDRAILRTSVLTR